MRLDFASVVFFFSIINVLVDDEIVILVFKGGQGVLQLIFLVESAMSFEHDCKYFL